MWRFHAILLIFVAATDLSFGQAPCLSHGQSVPDGAEWPKSDGCGHCLCRNGVTVCSDQQAHTRCPDVSHCSYTTLSPDQCCPVCAGCVSWSGRKVNLNETWQEDACTTCVCHMGKAQCQIHMCEAPLNCANTRIVPGECCPVCDGLLPTKVECNCPHGRIIDPSGRELCLCQTSPPYPPEGPITNCKPFRCHKQCLHGYKLDDSGCPTCKCVSCPPLQQCTLMCPLGFVHNLQGCPVCQCRDDTLGTFSSSTPWQTPPPDGRCLSANRTYAEGENWALDRCTHCVCRNGQATCTETVCSVTLHCANRVFLNGQCCPICGDTTPIIPGPGSYNTKPTVTSDGEENNILLTAVLVCVVVIICLCGLVTILSLCFMRQCKKNLRDPHDAVAAVCLTSVHNRPKSTNLDYQINQICARLQDPRGPNINNLLKPLDKVPNDKGLVNNSDPAEVRKLLGSCP